jgi:hypothetical protein
MAFTRKDIEDILSVFKKAQSGSVDKSTIDALEYLMSRAGDLDVSGDLADFIATKGQPNGIAELDSSGLLPAANLPISAMEYKGNYDIVTNTPTLVDGTGNAGDVYRNTSSGSRDFGSGVVNVELDSFIIYSGTVWERTPASGLYELLSNKDAAEGYVGLTGFKIKFRNLLNSFTSFLTNSNTAVRTYLFQDRDGTIADDTDITSAKARANHTGTQLASTISDFDTEVANETNVTANTTHRTSDGSDHSFIDQDVTSGSSPTFDGTNFTNIPLAGTADGIEVSVRNESGGVISKGQAVYISGYHVGSETAQIDKADADLGGAYPCIGLVKADIANNASGQIISQGKLENIDTSSWSVGAQLYISTDPNTTLGLTSTKPTGTAQIQPIAEVLRSHATMGVIQIARLNAIVDVPNIPDGKVWVGNGSGVATPTMLDKTAVGLANIDNTSDANKPVSTAQQTALDLKANKVSITGATKTKVTYNNDGIVTGGADATTADVADSTNKRYQTDAQQSNNDATSSIQTQLDGKQASLGYTAENSANKDDTGGYVGLTLFKINFKNVANTFISFFTNSNTAARTYTFQDRDGVIADDVDLALKADKFNNFVIVKSSSDFPTPSGGTHTLTDNVTYRINGSITLTNTLTFGLSNTVIGIDKSDDKLIYTGTSALLNNVNKDATVQDLTLAAITSGGSLFNFTGTTNKVEIKGNIIGSTKSLGVIDGGDVLMMHENLITTSEIGLEIKGSYSYVNVADNLWEGNTSNITCLNFSSGTFKQVKVSRNVFDVTSGQIGLNIGALTVTNGVIELTDFLGTGQYLVGINELTPNWQLRTNRGIGIINTILYQPKANERAFFSVRSSNSSRSSSGIVTNGYGTPSNATDSVTTGTSYDTGVSAGGYAGLESSSFLEFPVNSKPIFMSYIKTGSDVTNIRIWNGMFSQTLSNSDDQGGVSIAFRYSTVAGDTGWRAIVDTGSQTISANIGTVAGDTWYKMEVRVDYDNGKCYFQVNDGAWTTVSVMLASGSKLGFCTEITNTSASARQLIISRVDCNHL